MRPAVTVAGWVHKQGPVAATGATTVKVASLAINSKMPNGAAEPNHRQDRGAPRGASLQPHQQGSSKIEIFSLNTSLFYIKDAFIVPALFQRFFIQKLWKKLGNVEQLFMFQTHINRGLMK